MVRGSDEASGFQRLKSTAIIIRDKASSQPKVQHPSDMEDSEVDGPKRLPNLEKSAMLHGLVEGREEPVDHARQDEGFERLKRNHAHSVSERGSCALTTPHPPATLQLLTVPSSAPPYPPQAPIHIPVLPFLHASFLKTYLTLHLRQCLVSLLVKSNRPLAPSLPF